MNYKRLLLALAFLAAFLPTAARAQFPVVGADDVRTFQEGKKKHVLIDTRTRDEYRAGHIPGALHIPPEQIKASKSRLPKDLSTPVIFYCRGAG
jgi:3-mercaptopyruvate sulfurtransferase SseA